jgi:hypothetical protein
MGIADAVRADPGKETDDNQQHESRPEADQQFR